MISRRNSIMRYIDPAKSTQRSGKILTYTNKILHFFTLVVTNVPHGGEQMIYFNSDYDDRSAIHEWPVKSFLATSRAVVNDVYLSFGKVSRRQEDGT
jgi:hypothetical protein